MQAHSVKQGGGRGVKTASFNTLAAMRIDSAVQTFREGSRGFWKVFHGCQRYWEWNMGWSHQRCLDEWNFLWDRAPPQDKSEERDRVSGDLVQWMCVDLEEYRDRAAGTERRDDVVQSRLGQ